MYQKLSFCVSAVAVTLLAVAGIAHSTQSAGTFSPAGRMHYERQKNTATFLNNGKVLIAGGSGNLAGARGGNDSPLATAELYDPATGAFSLTGSMTKRRSGHA